MKALIWSIFILATLVWTGFTALVAQAIKWSAEHLSTGAAGTLEMATNNLAIPLWASPWLAPSDWATILMSVQSVLDNAAGAIPLVGSVLGWLAPLVWIIWALGMVVLFALLIAGMLLLKRFRDRNRLSQG